VLERPFANTETLQLAELHALAMFYTPLEGRFDRLTRLAQRAFGAPATAIALLHDGRLWMKSAQGWNIQEMALDQSFCNRVVRTAQTVVVEDTQLDPEFVSHPLVTQPPRFRFYAGSPLLDHNGAPIGTLAIYDIKPRSFSAADVQALRDLTELVQRELFAAEICEAQGQLVAKLDIARRSAMIDALTRVWNRRAAQDLLGLAMQQAERDDTVLGVCMIDVDNFKSINDTHGHQVGDQVLRKVASTLVSNVRSGDAVCRYGGDEFLLILQKTSREEVERIVERIEQRVSEFPVKTRSGAVPVAISTGVAVRSAGRRMASEDLVEVADQALYRAKQGRRPGARSKVTAA
jgi:diguanylate cyclase (GGDEF)-like protein